MVYLWILLLMYVLHSIIMIIKIKYETGKCGYYDFEIIDMLVVLMLTPIGIWATMYTTTVYMYEYYKEKFITKHAHQYGFKKDKK